MCNALILPGPKNVETHLYVEGSLSRSLLSGNFVSAVTPWSSQKSFCLDLHFDDLDHLEKDTFMHCSLFDTFSFKAYHVNLPRRTRFM